MDKVLVNHAMRTLNVIAIGLLCATLFEAMLTGIRTFVFANTSSKIDVLGAGSLSICWPCPLLLSGPPGRRFVARIRELENIRSFLTGNAITLVMDLLFSSVFLAVSLQPMAHPDSGNFHSPVRDLVDNFHAHLSAKLNEKFNRGAENQSFLVETISGIDTVKAMAVEPRWSQKWKSNWLLTYPPA